MAIRGVRATHATVARFTEVRVAPARGRGEGVKAFGDFGVYGLTLRWTDGDRLTLRAEAEDLASSRTVVRPNGLLGPAVPVTVEIVHSP